MNHILIPIVLPIAAALALLFIREKTKYIKELLAAGAALVALLAAANIFLQPPADLVLRWFGGARTGFGNDSYQGTPIPKIGTIGVQALFMTMDEMERTTIANPEGTGETFDAGSYAFAFCFARSLTDRFSIGLNAKYIHEQIYHSAAHGIAFDVGTLFETDFYGMKIGMSVTNYGTKMRLTGRDNRLILENARRLAQAGRALVIRLPLIAGINDGRANLEATADFALSLPGVRRIDILPYHRLGAPKYQRLEREYPLGGLPSLPAERAAQVRRVLERRGLEVHVGG